MFHLESGWTFSFWEGSPRPGMRRGDRSLIGCLMYLTVTRPNILFVVNLLSHIIHYASEMLLKEAKRILRYVKGTVDYGVKFEKCQEFKLYGFSNNDWVGSVDDMKSTSG